MTVESLITQHIDTWTSAVKTKSTTGRGSSKKLELYGVKKLRELILELAVRGKLVPQDPNDEPASVLLERIAAEKAQLVKEKKIKKPKKLPELDPAEHDYLYPKVWSTVRLGDIVTLENGDRSKNYPNKSVLVESGIPFVNAGHLVSGRIEKSEMTFITEERFELLRAGKFKNGDILFCLRGSLGKSALVENFDSGAIASSLVIVRADKSILPKYLMLYFDSPISNQNIKLYDNGTAQPNLSAADLAKFVLAVPSINEQHRIVAKVDELMALCDQLEQQTEASIEAHQLLVSSLLNTLTHSADADELMENWARISDHFDILFTTEESIDQLKQTILQLAVMGKLVPQDPNDEPASVLLERIAEEKAQLIKEKKIKKQKALPPIADDEKPFDLPKGWEWCRFDEIIDQRFPLSYGVLVPGNHVEGGVPLVRIGDIDLTNPPELPEKYISTEIDSKYERTRLFGGEILMAVVGSIGKLGIVPDSWKGANIARALCRILPWEGLSKDFLLVLLQSNYMQNSFMGDTRTLAQPTLNIGLIKNSLTPIPPLSEQLKIVSIVSDLFAICDNLKIGIKQSQTIQLNLTDVIVDQAI